MAVDIEATYRCDICGEKITTQEYIDQTFFGRSPSLHWPMSRGILMCEKCGLRIDRYVLNLRAEAQEERKKAKKNVGTE